MNRPRSRSRSPHQSKSQLAKSRSPSTNSEQTVNFNVLSIRNFPHSWKFERIKTFIRESCKSRTVVENIKNAFVMVEKPGNCMIKFSNSYICNVAFEELSGLEVEGRKLVVQYKKGNQLESRFKAAQGDKINRKTKSSLNRLLEADSPNTTDDFETYGLSVNFLNSLNIKPPLLSTVFVANLNTKVNEEKLREVFGYAGQIVNIRLIKKIENGKLSAKIEYDHPVEAVQAISMFHNQDLHDRKMIVQMDKSPRFFMPDGMRSRGPGLGINGAPLKGVRVHIEMEQLKKKFMQCLNEHNYDGKNNQDIGQQHEDTGVVAPIVQNPVPPVNPSPFSQPQPALMALTSMLNPQGVQNLQFLQSLLQQNPGTDLQGVLAAMQGQSTQAVPNMQSQPVARNYSEWSTQGHSSSRHSETSPIVPSFYSKADDLINMTTKQNNDDRKNYNDNYRQDDRDRDISRRSKSKDYDADHESPSEMLIFNNLPDSVSLSALSSKMREVGEVVFSELTGGGRALVRFRAPRHAHRALKLFDRSKVDGQTIDVRFF